MSARSEGHGNVNGRQSSGYYGVKVPSVGVEMMRERMYNVQCVMCSVVVGIKGKGEQKKCWSDQSSCSPGIASNRQANDPEKDPSQMQTSGCRDRLIKSYQFWCGQ